MNRITLKGVPAAWRNREEFNCNGTLTGSNHVNYHADQLEGVDLEAFRRDYTMIDYVVHSYKTPIAWVLNDGTEYKVSQRFSVTTSRHQSRLF